MLTFRETHIYFGIISWEKGTRKKWVQALELLSYLTANMFILALFFDIEWPADDGSCARNTNENSCLARTSLFDQHRKMCGWTPATQVSHTHTATTSQPSEMKCVWLRPVFNTTVLVIISLLVMVISGPIYTVVSFIIYLLDAPTAEDVEEQAAESSQRRSSAVLRLEEATAPTQEGEMLKIRTTKVFTLNTKVNSKLQENHHKAGEFRGQIVNGTKAMMLISGDPENQFQSFPDLLHDLSRYATTLSGRDRQRFQSQWGVDPSAQTQRDSKRLRRLDSLCVELDSVKKAARKKIEDLKSLPPAHVGIRILELFALDLIGRDSRRGKVFHNQFNTFETNMVVSWGAKCLAVTLLILVNAYLIFACMLYGQRQGLEWQKGKQD